MADELELTKSGKMSSLIVDDETLLKLSPEQQAKIIAISDENRRKAGLMGKLIGSDKKNAAINSAVLLCVLLIVVFILSVILKMFTGVDYTTVILDFVMSFLTLAIGYIFGKG